jgi:alpha-beta hydrolase superfamily lysophospholipase
MSPDTGILDGVRAALGCERPGLSPSAPVALWGSSGGGLASAWAAESRGRYAPELNIVGAVLGSPVADPGPSTYPGMLKLGVITVKVIAGRSVGPHLLSKAGSTCRTSARRSYTALI